MVGMKHRPRSSPAGDWTEANVHDPGITLLELLAFAAAALIATRALRRWRRRRKI
jgi:hypothetical protein